MTFTPPRRQPLPPDRRSLTRPRRTGWLAATSLGLGFVLVVQPSLSLAATERPASPLPAVRVQPDGTGETKSPTSTPTRGPAGSEPLRGDDPEKFKVATQTAAPAAGRVTVEAPAQDKTQPATGAHVMLYLVDSGDTLSAIAEKFGLKLSTILWNNWISDPNRIVVGQAIVLPSTDAAIHVVRPGETLNDVAARYEARLETVARLNQIDDPATLATGAQLLVPVSRYPDHALLNDLLAGAADRAQTSPLYLGDSVQLGLQGASNHQTVLPRVRLRAEVPFQVVLGPDAPAVPASPEPALVAARSPLTASASAPVDALPPSDPDAAERAGDANDPPAAEAAETALTLIDPAPDASSEPAGEPAVGGQIELGAAGEAGASSPEAPASGPDNEPLPVPEPGSRLTDDSVAAIGPEHPAAIPTPEPALAPSPADTQPVEMSAAPTAPVAPASAESTPGPEATAVTTPAGVPSESAAPDPEPARQAADATPEESEPTAAPVTATPTATPTVPAATPTPTVVPPTETPIVMAATQTPDPDTPTPVPIATERSAPREETTQATEAATTGSETSAAAGDERNAVGPTATSIATGSPSRRAATPSATATPAVSPSAESARSNSAAGPDAPPAGQIGVALIGEALKHVGKPYVWGGNGPNSFDCSGFTRYVYAQAGISIPRDLAGQLRAGPSVARGNLQAGDLVFFSNTYTAGLSHNGIYIGGGKFVHAQSERVGVTITAMSDPYWNSRYTGASRPGRR